MTKENSIIDSFYHAFSNKEADKMNALYHEKATFEDPAFGKLNSAQAQSMWSMLIERGGSNLQVEFEIIKESETSGEAIWEARYPFSKTKRQVHNVIKASFEFQDGKIIKHVDRFDLWKWSRMALGTSGLLLGWSPIIKNKVRSECLKSLDKYMSKS
ncbi:MAG: nuclear transport factor 2 family protein [Cyclobacteriaceae bacterium]